jgi:hypothetical protein
MSVKKFQLWPEAESVLKRMAEGDKHVFLDEGELLMLSQYVGEKEQAKHPNDHMVFNIECGAHGLWYATSPNVNGLLVAESTLDLCLCEIVPTMERMKLARDMG